MSEPTWVFGMDKSLTTSGWDLTLPDGSVIEDLPQEGVAQVMAEWMTTHPAPQEGE